MLRTFKGNFIQQKERRQTLNYLYFKSTKMALLFPQLCLGNGNRHGWWVWNQLDVINGPFLGWKWGLHWPGWEQCWGLDLLMHGMLFLYLSSTGGLSLKAAMKGCTTISECNMVGDGKNNLGMMDIKLKRFQCRPASPMYRVVFAGVASPHTTFLPVLSALILEKVLF